MEVLIWTNGFIIVLLAVSVTVSYLGYRKGIASGDKLDKQHLATNSRLDQLIVETRASGHAAGVEEERNKKNAV